MKRTIAMVISRWHLIVLAAMILCLTPVQAEDEPAASPVPDATETVPSDLSPGEINPVLPENYIFIQKTIKCVNSAGEEESYTFFTPRIYAGSEVSHAGPKNNPPIISGISSQSAANSAKPAARNLSYSSAKTITAGEIGEVQKKRLKSLIQLNSSLRHKLKSLGITRRGAMASESAEITQDSGNGD